MSSGSAAVVEHFDRFDNLAHYGRSLGLIDGLLKGRVTDGCARELHASHEVGVACG